MALPDPTGLLANTSISFFNVGACAAVAAVKIEIMNGRDVCPPAYASGYRCYVPGPYGREVHVEFGGRLEFLDITLLNPAEDDVNLTTPLRVPVSPSQRRNFVGVVLKAGTLPLSCAFGFTVVSNARNGGDIRPRYFRSDFYHAALDVGSADVISNGDSTITTLSEGASTAIDQLLVTALDMPAPVGISFATALGGTAAYASGAVVPGGGAAAADRLWGSTCEMSATGFVLYGRPPDIPLQVLRLDGAGSNVCDYDEANTGKFTAEVAFYNSVATGQSFIFAVGMSPFLPYSALQTSRPLSFTQRGIGMSTQPGELWVKVVDAQTSDVLVLSQRVPINRQRRNLIGVSLGSCATCFVLDLLQADNETHTAAPVPPAHFRLIFAHAALTMPAATVVANDDIQLLTVSPGSRGQLDHPRLPPHQAGRLLKVTFDTGGHSSNKYSTLIDVSTLCEGAAYAFVLMGTLDRLDLYDPLLVQVDGTSTACSLPTAAVNAGHSSSLTVINMEPHAAAVRFEWGQTLLSLTRRSVALQFRSATVTDVPVGDLFVRLLMPDPPNQPLTPIIVVTVHRQARNVVIARAEASGATANAGGSAAITPLQGMLWRLADLTSAAEVISSSSTRALLVNALEDSSGAEVGVNVQVTGSLSRSLSLPPGGHTTLDYPSNGGLSVTFRDGSTALGVPSELPFGDACSQSVQLIVVGGVRGSAAPTSAGAVDASPGATHVDGADRYCRLVVPEIPEREPLEEATTQPPTTTSTLDLFGLGDGGLIQDSSAAVRLGSSALWLVLLLTASSVVVAQIALQSTFVAGR